MRIRLQINTRNLIDLRFFETEGKPQPSAQPAEPDRNSMGMPSAERANSWVPSNRRGFGFGKPEI